MNPTITDIQKNLRVVRKRAGLTLQQVEQKSNGKYKNVTVGSYERGDRQVTMKILIELANFYNVSITEIVAEL